MWVGGGRSANRLLSGDDIAAAKAWAARRPKDAPEPTELHLAFLRASEDEETGRVSAERRRLQEMAAAQEESDRRPLRSARRRSNARPTRRKRGHERAELSFGAQQRRSVCLCSECSVLRLNKRGMQRIRRV